jgi:Holliday junction resolvase RusA-like endonuclease
VLGEVVPQGSAKGFSVPLKDRNGRYVVGQNGHQLHRTIVTADNPALKEWRRLVSDAARHAVGEDFRLFTGPVALTAVFYLPRPKSARKSQVVPTTRPDVDKCLRGIFDSLTQVLFRDDSQVYRALVEKQYADPHQPARAVIAVEG